MGQFLPADHAKGDANTIGGYMAVHQRPAAFEGPDGRAYSVDLVAQPTGDPARPWGAFLLFVRWSVAGQPALDGHVESDFQSYGESEAQVLAELGTMPLSSVRTTLSEILKTDVTQSTRKWWDAMGDA
jgi:hypothetical protein